MKTRKRIISLMLNDEEMQKINDYAKEIGRPKSALIRSIILLKIDDYNKAKGGK